MPRAPAARRRTRASRELPPRRRSCCAETPASEFATLRRAETGSVVATAAAHDGNGMRKRHRCRQHTGARMQAPARTLDAASAVASWACAPRVSRRLWTLRGKQTQHRRVSNAQQSWPRAVLFTASLARECAPQSRPAWCWEGVAKWHTAVDARRRATTTTAGRVGALASSGQLRLEATGVGGAMGVVSRLTEASNRTVTKPPAPHRVCQAKLGGAVCCVRLSALRLRSGIRIAEQAYPPPLHADAVQHGVKRVKRRPHVQMHANGLPRLRRRVVKVDDVSHLRARVALDSAEKAGS